MLLSVSPPPQFNPSRPSHKCNAPPTYKSPQIPINIIEEDEEEENYSHQNSLEFKSSDTKNYFYNPKPDDFQETFEEASASAAHTSKPSTGPILNTAGATLSHRFNSTYKNMATNFTESSEISPRSPNPMKGSGGLKLTLMGGDHDSSDENAPIEEGLKKAYRKKRILKNIWRGRYERARNHAQEIYQQTMDTIDNKRQDPEFIGNRLDDIIQDILMYAKCLILCKCECFLCFFFR